MMNVAELVRGQQAAKSVVKAKWFDILNTLENKHFRMFMRESYPIPRDGVNPILTQKSDDAGGPQIQGVQG
jgi:hypothetical protein